MIKRLRRNFIIVAMCSIFAVLVVIVCSLNVASYRSAVTRADRILNMLAENEGHFPDNKPFERKMIGGKERPQIWDKEEGYRGLSPETPYDTRFFSVRLDRQGELVSVDTGRIAAVETDDAVEYARQVQSSGKSTGFFGDYRFLRQSMEENGDINRKVYMSYDNGVHWQLSPPQMQMPESVNLAYGSDAIVEGYELTADISEAWTLQEYETRGYLRTRVSYTIDGYDITWICPYLYVFGGYLPDNTLSTQILRAVLARLEFTPII